MENAVTQERMPMGLLAPDGRFTPTQAGQYYLVTMANKDPERERGRVFINAFDLKLKLLWETKNKANQIFNPTRKDDPLGPNNTEKDGDNLYSIHRNMLYVVADPADNTFRVSIDLSITGADRRKFVCAAFDESGKIPNTDVMLASDSSLWNMVIPAGAEAAVKEYEIQAGYDENDNNMLDSEEASQLRVYDDPKDGRPRFAIVKGINSAKYDQHNNALYNRSITIEGLDATPNLVMKYCRNLLRLFYDGGPSVFFHDDLKNGMVENGDSLDAFANNQGFSEWLSHNSGAHFNEDGITANETFKRYEWNQDSIFSIFLAERSPFRLTDNIVSATVAFETPTETGRYLKHFYENNIKAQAEQMLTGMSAGSVVTIPPEEGQYVHFPNQQEPHLFTSISSNWVAPVTLIVGAKTDYGTGYANLAFNVLTQQPEFDTFAAIARGRVVDPKYKFTVTKVNNGSCTVTSVRFLCVIEDLYDFTYEDAPPVVHAAALQIGYGNGSNGRNHGKINRNKIVVDKIFQEPFTYATYITPSI